MPVITFTGRIIPEALKVTLAPLVLGWSDASTNFNAELTITLKDGHAVTKCETNQFDKATHLARLYKEAYELTSVSTNLVTFHTGFATFLVFETITYPDGKTEPIFAANKALAKYCTVLGDGQNITEIIHLTMREPLIRFALHDLNECFIPNRATVNCARVVETIRHMIYPVSPDASRKQAWMAMQNALNVTQEYIELIMSSALTHRHGSYAPIEGTTNDEITRRAWQLMDRFLHYRLRKNQPLLPPEFPPLS